MQMKRPISLFGSLAIVLACGFGGCSDSAEQRPDGFRGACRSCIGDEPQGPNESMEACEEFAAEFQCENASLTGDCGNEVLADKAVCEVTACELQPVCPADRN